MGYLNKVLDVMGFVEPIEEETQPAAEAVRTAAPERANNVKPAVRNNNLVTLPTREITVVNNNQQGVTLKMTVSEPRKFEEAQAIANHLLHKQAVVINIEECNPDIAAKIIDFIGGVIYAIDGSIQKVSQGIILAAPPNVDVDSELKQKLDTDANLFPWVDKYNRKGDF